MKTNNKTQRGGNPHHNPSKRRLGKLKGDQAQIHIATGKHKWKALRELKKARIEAGLYQDVRETDGDKKKTDLLKVAQKQSAKVCFVVFFVRVVL